MIAMLPVGIQQDFMSFDKIKSFGLNKLLMEHFPIDYDTNPTAGDHIYSEDLCRAGIKGVRQIALQIIKERLYVSRSL